MKKNNVVYYILCGLGVALFIAGIVFICITTNHLGTNHSGIVRASTSIEFGGDFYTQSAQATGLAANAVIDTYALLKTAIGVFFMFIGAVESCMVFALRKKECFLKPVAAVATEEHMVESVVLSESEKNTEKEDGLE